MLRVSDMSRSARAAETDAEITDFLIRYEEKLDDLTTDYV